MTPHELLAIDGLRVHYRRSGEGPPIVFLHGWGGSSISFGAVLPALQPAHTCIAVDMPGFGLSALPPVPWGVGDYADLTAALLRRLFPLETAVEAGASLETSATELAMVDRGAVALTRGVALVGHSFGGRVGITLASRYPELVTRLVLVAAAGVKLPLPRDVALKAAAYRAMRAGIGRLPEPVRAALLGRLRGAFGSHDYQTAGPMRPTMVKVIGEDLTPLLPAIACPTLLLWGARDEEVPLRAAHIMRERIPNARLEVFPTAGHFPFVDAPREFAAVVGEFLA